MADAASSDGAVSNERGVLANLPRTRPQRSSARRAAARDSARSAPAPRAGQRPPRRRKPVAATGRSSPRRARPSAATERARSARPQTATAPRQGYDAEPAGARGSVHPPGGAELVASAAELVGELAKAGFSRGERAIRDLLGRLPL